ncbi:hypothetical protein ACJX0J_040164 [Zea mays]
MYVASIYVSIDIMHDYHSHLAVVRTAHKEEGLKALDIFFSKLFPTFLFQGEGARSTLVGDWSIPLDFGIWQKSDWEKLQHIQSDSYTGNSDYNKLLLNP